MQMLSIRALETSLYIFFQFFTDDNLIFIRNAKDSIGNKILQFLSVIPVKIIIAMLPFLDIFYS